MAGLLSGDVSIPHVGKFPKAAVVIGVGGVIGLILYERHKQSAAAASAAPAAAAGSDPYPADGTTGDPSDPNSTDPSSGITYGDEQAGYGGAGALPLDGIGANGDAYPWDGSYGNSSDPFSMDTGSGETYGDEGYTGGSGSTGTSGPPFSTNAQWSQYVLNYFSANAYSDLAGRTDAIGLYLSGQAVDQTQKTYTDDAIAIGGSPPVASASGFPPSIRSSGSPGTTGSVTTPNVVGVNVEQATQILKSAGLKAHGPAGVKGIVHQVTKQSPSAGAKVKPATTVNLTVKNVTENKLVPSGKPPITTPGR